MWAAGKENKGTRDDGDDIRGSNGGMTGQEEEEKEGGRARNEREVGSIERAGKQNTKRIYLWRLSKQETPGPPTREAAFRADLVSSFFLLSSFFSFFFSKLETNRRRLTRTVFDSNVFLTVCQEVGGEEEFVEIFFFLSFLSFPFLSGKERFGQAPGNWIQAGISRRGDIVYLSRSRDGDHEYGVERKVS